ncbi:unnamed protein product [Cochlearia groenlandica]
MRRESQQHGLIRTYRILPPPLNPRLVHSFTSTPNFALFTKLPSKSHRKVLSCHVHWLRSNDIASSNYKLLTWQILTGHGDVLDVSRLSDLNVNYEEEEEEEEEEAKGVTMKRENGDKEDDDDGGCHEDDESKSFYDVGTMMMMEHVLDNYEEDGWCLV